MSKRGAGGEKKGTSNAAVKFLRFLLLRLQTTRIDGDTIWTWVRGGGHLVVVK